LLEYPHYTKPGQYMGEKVPEILLGGNHKNIDKWRRDMSISNTFYNRPDLLSKAELTKEDMAVLERIFT